MKNFCSIFSSAFSSAFLSGFCFSAFFAVSADASIIINPPPPYANIIAVGTTVTSSTGFNITWAGGPEVSTAIPDGGFFNSNQGFRFVNTSIVDNNNNGLAANQNNWIMLDIQSSVTTLVGNVIAVTLSLNTTACNSAIPLQAAGVVTSNVLPPVCTNGNNCQGTGGLNLSALYGLGSVTRVAFSLLDLCNAAYTSGVTVDLCTSYYASGAPIPSASPGNTYPAVPINVTIGGTNDLQSTGPVGTLNCSDVTTTPTPAPTTDTGTFNLQLSDVPPSISACPTDPTQFYFPGDGQIYLDIGNFPQVSTSGFPLVNFIFLGNLNGAAIPPLSGLSQGTNSIIQYVGVGGSQQVVTGFTNSTNGSDNVYQTDIYLQDQSGLISAQASGCQESVTSQTISGVLTESHCFIATATYHDGHAAPVMLLRRFRDEVLAKSAWGRDFIETYYHYSPALAEWAWDKPIIRSIALKFLTPIELYAWAVLKFTHADPVSNQPYIDSIKKQMATQDAANGTTPSTTDEGYTAQEKKKLQASPTPSESYTDKLKKQLQNKSDAPTAPTGYSEKEKAKLPAEEERESPIKAYKEGRETLREPKRKEITTGFEMKIGISPNEQVNVSNGVVSYDQVYGSGWKPDFYLHFEHQLFHSESWGSIAGTAELGFNYASGYGQLSFPFPNNSTGTTQSQTVFQFIQVPFLLGGNYRFNLFKYLRPYVGLSVGPLGYIELRQDTVPAKKGIAFAYSSDIGVSFLLDFLDKETSKAAYESDTIQHVYLIAEYMYMNTLGGNVSIKRGGLYSGILFEF